MNVVCFSYNAPPLNDSEAYCTARLLSALVSEGIDVHLVTIKLSGEGNEEDVPSLLDRRITVTRIQRNTPNLRSRITGAFRYSFHGSGAAHIGDYIATMKAILKEYKHPWLITRASPLISNAVGYYCKVHTACWIAHFSDPCPGYGMYSRRNCWKRLFDGWWSRRIISQSSLVTVTSRNAIRWFSESLGEDLSSKMHVL